MMIKRTAVILFLSLGISCANSDTDSVQSVTLKVKDCFTKVQDKVNICLDSVYNDSRCPKGIECIWEGDASADFTMTATNITNRFTLHSNKKFQNDTIIDGISITLIHIKPYPISDEAIDPDSYTVEISISAN